MDRCVSGGVPNTSAHAVLCHVFEQSCCRLRYRSVAIIVTMIRQVFPICGAFKEAVV